MKIEFKINKIFLVVFVCNGFFLLFLGFLQP
ncbi:Uncharacterised protein [Yersinia frederiksenii]|uniref:Uncharacterized protein n=1 Tax=Yersinia frederiksenii TaxID=29484 RepID=A0AAI9EQF9_YERFR|nr:Uncharacterised protein [Yersinia frederiksenii]CFR25086.1 Uncharacterised protein [Yersinia frederiksenii]